MRKLILFILIAMVIFPLVTSAQVWRIESDWRYGQQVWYFPPNKGSLWDAHGPDVFKYLTHFVGADFDSAITNHDVEWIIIPTGDMDSSQVTHLDSVGGMIGLGAASTDSAGVQMQLHGENFAIDTALADSSTAAASIVYFGTRIYTAGDSGAGVIFGLVPEDASIISIDDIGVDDGITNGIYFEQMFCDTLFFVTERGGNETKTFLGEMEADTWDNGIPYELEFYYNMATGRVDAYKDGVLSASHTTDLPCYHASTTLLTPTFAFENGTGHAGGNTFIIDWLRVIQIRIPE